MYRNLNNRVEAITPILDPGAQATLKHILDVMLADQRQAWDMQPDGTYVQRKPLALHMEGAGMLDKFELQRFVTAQE